MEFIVLAVCLQGPGCNEAGSAYYKQNVYLQNAVKKAEVVADKAPEIVKNVLVPVAAVGAGYHSVIKVVGNVNVGLARNYQELFYSKGF